ncbi:MAG: bifunctional riboflavin kinase/FMN adenylyltransferase [Pseudomonadota bacterium]
MLQRFHLRDGLAAFPSALRGAAVAIGNFDGLHRGHQHVFAQLKRLAATQNGPAIALTFEPHPRAFFAKSAPPLRLSDVAAKARVAKAIGLDGMVVLHFDQALSEIEPADFVQRILIEAIGCSAVVVGENFRFGRKRAGDVAYLAQQGRQFGFSVAAAELLTEAGAAISSTRIREALCEGNLAEANRLLGYSWFTSVTIVGAQSAAQDRLCLHTNGIARLLEGHFAVRGSLGGWPIEGLVETHPDCPGNLQITWADQLPTGKDVSATLAFLARIEDQPAKSNHWSAKPALLDHAIGFA